MRVLMSIPMLAILILTTIAMHVHADSDLSRAIKYGAVAQLTVRVIDDENLPVGGVEIKARFDAALSATGEVKSFVTDTNGVAVVSGRTGRSVSLRATKAGYYGSTEEIGYAGLGLGVKEGRWQPWNMAKEIVLRPIKKPSAVKVPVENWRNADVTGLWIGFDLERYDFVRPHGEGMVADMEVKIDWDGRRFPDYTGMDVRIRFPEKCAGGYYQQRFMGSDFKDSYLALPNAIYEKEFRFYEQAIRDKNGELVKYETKDFDPAKVLIVRSRCVTDESGKLKEARYSQISNFRFSCGDSGACIMLQPIYNPTPNDTNLEPK